jgi:hypothetical protein
MSFVCPLPPVKCFVRAEYLYDFKKGHGDLVEAIWVSVKSIRAEAFRFESYLPQYAALYDKLPIHAYCWKPIEAEDLPLDMLEIWDSLAYDVTVVDKPFLKGLKAVFFGKDRKLHEGEYMFTIDTCNPDPRIPDFTLSETVDEHKSYNVIRLFNGQYALQPNNRCQFFDSAFNPRDIKFPDFNVATKKFRVEQSAKWRLGDTDSFTYDNRGE